MLPERIWLDEPSGRHSVLGIKSFWVQDSEVRGWPVYIREPEPCVWKYNPEHEVDEPEIMFDTGCGVFYLGELGSIMRHYRACPYCSGRIVLEEIKG